MLSLASDRWAEDHFGGEHDKKSPQTPSQPCGQGCFGIWAASVHSRTGEAQLPHRTAQKQLLHHPSPCISEEAALQLQENAKLRNRTSRGSFLQDLCFPRAGVHRIVVLACPCMHSPPRLLQRWRLRPAPQPLPFLLLSLCFWGKIPRSGTSALSDLPRQEWGGVPAAGPRRDKKGLSLQGHILQHQ